MQIADDRSTGTPDVEGPTEPPPNPIRTNYDVVVVGDGPQAYEAARVAAEAGRSVALVRPCGAPGGDAPGGAAVYRALDRLAGEEPRGDGWPGEPIDLPALMGQEPQPVQAEAEVLRLVGVALVQGESRFVSPRSVLVGDRELVFRSAVVVPPLLASVAELDSCPKGECLTETSLSGLSQVPYRLALVGNGYAACRWAHLFCRLGCEVHLISKVGRLVPGEDPELEFLVREQLARQAIRLHLACREVSLERMGRRKAITLVESESKEKLLVDEVLACGRQRFALDAMGLAAAGVECPAGVIVVDRWLRTGNHRIFAVCGDPEATGQAGMAAARVAGRNASSRFSSPVAYRTFDWRWAPRRLRLDREMLIAGATPDDLDCHPEPWNMDHESVVVADTPTDSDRIPKDVLRVVVETLTGRPLAVMAVSACAETWAGPLLMLMQERRSVRALARLPLAGSPHAACLQRIGRRWETRLRQRFGDGIRGAARVWAHRAGRWVQKLIRSERTLDCVRNTGETSREA